MFFFGHEADQAAGGAGFQHDLIAGIDAQAAVDALILQPVADVDAGWADLLADAAIDAGAGLGCARAGGLTMAARLAALHVIAHRARGGIEHDALKA